MWRSLRRYLPIITSEALTTTVTVSPTASSRSSTASLVMEEVTMLPPPMSTRIWAVVWPLARLTIWPLIWLRALSLMTGSPGVKSL